MENRLYKRVACEIAASFRNIDGKNSNLEETTVRDISEGGVRFRSNTFTPIQDRLSMRLNTSKTRFIEAVVKPAWIRELPNVHQFDIGASFILISKEDKARLHDFLTIKIA